MLEFSEGMEWGSLDPQFVRRKYVDHRASRSDERAFLWNAWLLRQWQAGGATGNS
jgi:hypothetical protein